LTGLRQVWRRTGAQDRAAYRPAVEQCLALARQRGDGGKLSTAWRDTFDALVGEWFGGDQEALRTWLNASND
jgi:hypothetical protein